MRDLGSMGESTFSLWCADVGLIPNGSRIDKTGWDFLVEFPFDDDFSQLNVHKPAFVCKIQIKATDKQDRKLSIKLSNLRRLATDLIPTFFVFIEFDSQKVAQKAFVVHVDEAIACKILKRLCEAQKANGEDSLNKKSMQISYGDDHRMKDLDGNCLKEVLLSHIGDNMAQYIANKKNYLECAGFDSESFKITFMTEGVENLKKLVDVSIGIEKEVEISRFTRTGGRFGIADETYSVDSEGGKLQMPEVKPSTMGTIRFKEDMLSSGLSFESNLYSSPFNIWIPNELVKIRFEGDFFSIVCTPWTRAVNFSFEFGSELRLSIKGFRDAVKLIGWLNSPEKNIFVELDFDISPTPLKLNLEVSKESQEIDVSSELSALECALRIANEFEVADYANMSIHEILMCKEDMYILERITSSQLQNFFQVEFNVEEDDFNPTNGNNSACILSYIKSFGNHLLGVLFLVVGEIKLISNNRYRLSSTNSVVEKKIVIKKDGSNYTPYLLEVIEGIKKKYSSQYKIIVTCTHSKKGEEVRIDPPFNSW